MDLLTRKEFLISSLLAATSAAMPATQENQTPNPTDITVDDLKVYEKMIGITFTDEERQSILNDVRRARASMNAMRRTEIPYTVEPALIQTPLGGGTQAGAKISAKPTRAKKLDLKSMSDEDIAFSSVRELGELVRTKQLSPVRLTEIYLARLKEYGPKLLNVISLLEDRARASAKQAEAEIKAGKYRGPLHGLPYALKDLFATKGDLTTWGAGPYKDQKFDYDAEVVNRLEKAGAILIMKSSLGALAMNDVWFGGKTKNPWNPARGSSGSSAGSASSTAAGLVAFSIGTETYGSILSPSNECRVTGLRPSYGRVSRAGGMALSWTMDKVGPICREVEDCALVLGAIAGSDPNDPSAVDRPYSWPKTIDPKKVKLGVLSRKGSDGKPNPLDENDAAIKILRECGFDPKPVSITAMGPGIDMIINVECASAFDELTRSQRIYDLKDSAWPGIFRAARYVPAVEYVQAQRLRRMFMDQFDQEFGDFDAVMGTGIGQNLIQTNYTGHPQILIPFGDDGKGISVSRSFVGRLYQEDMLCAITKVFQDKAGFLSRRPDLSKL
ncbi:MAG: amidase [Fimbriimonadaceae bacterium]|nr:amidase [Fimbriimonadaceae bacterium]